MSRSPRSQDCEALSAQPVVAVLRDLSPARSIELAQRAWDLGIAAVEVTVQHPRCIPSLEAVVREGRAVGQVVGAGSVMDVDQVPLLRQLGVDFTVAPGLDPAVIAACQSAGLPHVPGIATPSELQRALSLGLTWIKAFPATSLGTAWFTAMKAPFPEVRMMATGGIDAHNARAFLDAGATCVGVGSALANDDQLDDLATLLHRPA